MTAFAVTHLLIVRAPVRAIDVVGSEEKYSNVSNEDNNFEDGMIQ
jgi:hypothetical protein